MRSSLIKWLACLPAGSNDREMARQLHMQLVKLFMIQRALDEADLAQLMTEVVAIPAV